VEAGRRANALWLRLEAGAVGKLSVFQLLNRGELAVDQAGVRQRPEVLGRLELRRVGRGGQEEEQMDMLGDVQSLTGLPAGTVQDEHKLLGGSGTHLARERGEFHLNERDGDSRGEVEEGAA
jgi:hypothetical protein